ncbi:hypothetical protein GCM10029963_03430 [Micromonospora andamanensis]
MWLAMLVGGLLAMLYWPWLRLRARRRSSGYAVEGGYDITEDNIMMRSGSESGGIAWDGVTQVRSTPSSGSCTWVGCRRPLSHAC